MILEELYRVIADRRRTPLPNSYVNALQIKGKETILKKIGEESAEVLIASLSGGREQIVHEMADLWFHCLVLLEEEDIPVEAVFEELRRRRAARGGKND